MKSSSALIRRRNCLNTIRLLTAFQVMLQHLGENFPIPGYLKPLEAFLSLFPGVPFFFILSGFLIWNSIENTPSYGVFLKKRFLRIYPELWVSLFFEILLLVMMTPEPLPLIPMVLFAFGQATVFQFWKPGCVEFFGSGTPNGALWTIPVMVLFYVLVWWVHRVLHGKKFRCWIFWLAGAALLALGIRAGEKTLPEILYKLLRYSLLPHFWIFLWGMLTAEYAGRILPFLEKYWYCFLLTAILMIFAPVKLELGYYPLMSSLLLFWGWVGFGYRFPGLRISPDVSYGIYIYHMLIANAFLTCFGSESAWPVPVILVLSLGAGILSTHFIGSLAKYVKKQLVRRSGTL